MSVPLTQPNLHYCQHGYPLESSSEPNPYSLSSWNYGCFYQTNYPVYNRYKPQKTVPKEKYERRKLKPEEKIVTENILHGQKDLMAMHGLLPKEEINQRRTRNKSANYTRLKNSTNQNENEDTNNNLTTNYNNNIKTDTSNYKYKLSHAEWKEVKNKQLMIFNKIKKIKEEEELKMKKINNKVNKHYNEITKNKYKEWKKKKIEEDKLKKKLKQQEEQKKAEEEEKKKEEKEMKMNEWFKRQAEKNKLEKASKK